MGRCVSNTSFAHQEGFFANARRYELGLTERLGLTNQFDLGAPGLLGYLAGQVTKIELGAGLLPIFTRHPLLAAQEALTAQFLTGGRFILGLGLEHKVIVEDFFGESFAPPTTAPGCSTTWSPRRRRRARARQIEADLSRRAPLRPTDGPRTVGASWWRPTGSPLRDLHSALWVADAIALAAIPVTFVMIRKDDMAAAVAATAIGVPQPALAT